MHVGEKAAGNCYCEQSEQYRVIVTVHIVHSNIRKSI